MQFVGQVVGDLGATISAGNVVIGERLGLYRALAAAPADARALAAATGTDERYVEEWLRGQAAGGYVEHDATSGRYSMTTRVTDTVSGLRASASLYRQVTRRC